MKNVGKLEYFRELNRTDIVLKRYSRFLENIDPERVRWYLGMLLDNVRPEKWGDIHLGFFFSNRLEFRERYRRPTSGLTLMAFPLYEDNAIYEFKEFDFWINKGQDPIPVRHFCLWVPDTSGEKDGDGEELCLFRPIPEIRDFDFFKTNLLRFPERYEHTRGMPTKEQLRKYQNV